MYLPRIEDLYHKYGNRFLDKVLTRQEKQYCIAPVSLKMKIARIGGRIAIKESVVKTLGIGISSIGNPRGVSWTQVEVVREEKYAPRVVLHGVAAELAMRQGLQSWHVSLTHDGDYAMAMVMASGA